MVGIDDIRPVKKENRGRYHEWKAFTQRGWVIHQHLHSPRMKSMMGKTFDDNGWKKVGRYVSPWSDSMKLCFKCWVVTHLWDMMFRLDHNLRMLLDWFPCWSSDWIKLQMKTMLSWMFVAKCNMAYEWKPISSKIQLFPFDSMVWLLSFLFSFFYASLSFLFLLQCSYQFGIFTFSNSCPKQKLRSLDPKEKVPTIYRQRTHSVPLGWCYIRFNISLRKSLFVI